MNFDDINFEDMSSGYVSFPVNDPKGLFKETLVATLENNAILKVILKNQQEIMDHLGIGNQDERTKQIMSDYEVFLSARIQNISNKF